MRDNADVVLARRADGTVIGRVEALADGTWRAISLQGGAVGIFESCDHAVSALSRSDHAEYRGIGIVRESE